MNGRERAQYIHDRLLNKYQETLPVDWIFGQMAHETANFTSDLAVNHFNFGGLTQPEPNGLPQPDGSLFYKSFANEMEGLDYFADYLHLYKSDGIFEAKNPVEYAAALKHGGWYTDAPENYAQGIISHINQDGSYGGLVNEMTGRNTGVANAELLPAYSMENLNAEEPDFMDKLVHPIMESPVVKTLRVGLMQEDNPAERDYTFTQDDIDLVNKEFNGDIASQNFIYSHAHSHDQLLNLIQMQRETVAMEKAISNSSYGVGTVGSFIGNVVAEALNPLNYLSLGIINKGSLIQKVLKSAAFNGAVNTADAELRTGLTGIEQNLVSSAAIGAAVGGVMPVFATLAKQGANALVRDAAQKSADDLMEIKGAADSVLQAKPPTKAKIWKRINNLADKNYKAANERLQVLMDNGNALVVPKASLKVLSRILRTELPDSTRALHTGNTTIFVKEAVEGMDTKNFDNLLLHEIGVHGLPQQLKEPVLKFVRKQMEKPKGLWREALDRATAATGKGETVDPEEVLGYWAELRGDDPKGGFLTDITDRFNKMLGRTDMTNKEVLDILKKNRDDIVYAKEAPGDVVKLSADGDVTPNSVVRLGYDERPKQNWIARKFEDSWLYGTPFGKLTNSKLKYARQIGRLLFSDARMRDNNVGMSAEDVLAHTQGQINIPYKKFLETYRNYMWKQHHFAMFRPKHVEALNKQIMLAHDYIYAGHSLPEGMELTDEVRQLAKLLNDVEAMEIKLAKDSGYITDPAWENLDKGTRRVFNQEKWLNFVTEYKGDDGVERAKKDLEEYFYMAGYLKREENRALLQKQIDAENADKIAAYEKASKNNPELPPPELREMTDKDLDDFIRSEAKKTAEGYIDMDTSNFSAAKDGDNAVMPWMRHRMHMDTSFATVLNGRRFSFDDNLRSYDLQLILQRTTRRWAGEIALHTVFNGKTTFNTIEGGSKALDNTIENYRQMLIKEGKQRVYAGGMKQSEVDEMIEIFDESIRDIKGLPPNSSKGMLSYGADILRNATYARVGGNMALNQKMDFGNAIAYTGLRVLTSMLPYGKLLQKRFYGKNYFEAASEATVKLMGEDLRDLNFAFANLWNSRRGSYFVNGSALDTINNIVGTSAEIANKITGLGNLTTRMVRDARIFTYMDLTRAVKSFELTEYGYKMRDTFGMFGSRTPFSQRKLAAAGIHDKKKFFTELKGYLKEDGQLDVDKLAAENPTLHARVWKLIDNQAKRAVVEPTIGNKNIRASSNSFFKILFQFKNFAFYATNSQAFRKLSNREREDFLSTAYETAFAAGITYLGILGAAYSKHWNNEADRQSYIDKRTDDFLWGVATRSGTIGSPIAFAVDFADTMGWKQSFRTTSGSSRYANNGDLITTAARGVAQSPALETLSLMLQNAYGYYDTGLTQENIKDTAKIYIPANNNYFMAGVLNNMIESFDIPEK